MKDLIKKMIISLYVMIAVASCAYVASHLYTVGNWYSVALAAIFSLAAIGNIYMLSDKNEDEEEKFKLPQGTCFVILIAEVIAMVWASVLLYSSGMVMYGVIADVMACLGGYFSYLWIKSNKK